MLIGISILISFIVVCVLIAIFPLKVKKKPLFTVTAISAIILLFAAYSASTLAWWYGIMVFAGLLLALAILIGKKTEWLKQVDRTEEDVLHKPFPLQLKETGNGHSVFDEEFQKVLSKDFVAERLRNQRFEKKDEKVIPTVIPSLEENKEWEKEDYSNIMTQDFKEKEFILDELPDFKELEESEMPATGNSSINVYDSEIEWNEAIETDDTVHDDLSLSLEVEELSDEWLNTRLNALYGEEQAAAIEDAETSEDYSFYNEPIVTDIEKEPAFTTGNGQEYTPTVDEVEYEDLSQHYYNGQRGKNDGTTE